MTEDRSRQRLGRGLAALIGSSSGSGMNPPVSRQGLGAVPSEEGAFAGERSLPIRRIMPNPHNPRRNFDEAELADLTASIRTHGVVQPILVRPKPGMNGIYEIVAGERRWRAAEAAGLPSVPAVVRPIGDRESLEIAIIENVQRADLNAIEEALAYEMLIEEHGYTQGDLADVLGKSRSHVANTLRLLKLPEEVRGMVRAGTLSAGHARTAVSAEDPASFAQAIVEKGLSVREAEEMAREGAAATPRPRPTRRGATLQREKDADTAALERLLSERLGMRVEIRLPEQGGSLTIGYGSIERLDELCRLLQTGSTVSA